MIKKAEFLRGAAIFVGIAGVIFAVSQFYLAGRDSSKNENRLRAAPSWALLDSAGKKHQLEDFLNQPVVLHFWASWCPPCLGEIPHWLELSQSYKDQPIAFVAISIDSHWKDALQVLPEKNVPSNVLSLLDETGKSAENYGSFQFPETYLLNSKHEILMKWVGPQNWKNPVVDRWIRSALSPGLPEQTPRPETSLPPSQ